MARELGLSGHQTIVLTRQEEISISTDKISVDAIIDNGERVVAKLSFFHPSGTTKDLILWEGEEYISAGQWTDDNADARIKNLLGV